MTTATASTWPSAVEQDEALEQLSKAHAALDSLGMRFLHYDEERERLPNLEEIGRLHRSLVYGRYEAEEIGKELDRITDVLDRAAWMTGEREERDDAR